MESMRPLFASLEKYLLQQAMTFEKEVRAAAKESISPKGKLIRPTLVFAAAAGGNADKMSLIRRAAIVELTHLSTLIHDDVIDNASVRRGAATPNKKYGARTAILLGDAIFAHTMSITFEENDAALSKKIANCVRTICEGEIRQTLADRKKNVTRRRYYEIAYGKTAVLFELACALGAMATTSKEGWIEAAEEAGKQLGIAYQIYDDICDWFMSEKDAGKTLGTDLVSGKQTFPLIALFETMDSERADGFAKNLSSQNPEEIIGMMKSSGVEKICAETQGEVSVANYNCPGQLVITDHMINRVSQNWENGVRTHIFLDEFHTLLQHKYSANFFDSAYRRFRKRNAWTTSLTQNVEYVLDSLTARTMLSNSEFIVMLNQSASDREQLAELLHISGEQMKYITNARAGNGLARIGSALVPFYNQMSKNSEIYKLMSTKPEDFEKTWGSPGDGFPES